MLAARSTVSKKAASVLETDMLKPSSVAQLHADHCFFSKPVHAKNYSFGITMGPKMITGTFLVRQPLGFFSQIFDRANQIH